MYSIFKTSEYFENMTKAAKRDYTLTYFTQNIQNNFFLKEKFKCRDDYVLGLQLKQPAIIGFKLG